MISNKKEGKTSAVEDNHQEIKSIDYYLSISSIDENYNKNAQHVDKLQNEDKKQIQESQFGFKELFLFLGRFVVSFLQFLIVSSVVVIGLVIIIIKDLVQCKCNSAILEQFWMIFSCSAIVYAYINYSFLDIGNLNVERLYSDGVFFIISSLFAFSYIKSFRPIKWLSDFGYCIRNVSQIGEDDSDYFEYFIYRQDYLTKGRGDEEDSDQEYEENEDQNDNKKDANLQALYFTIPKDQWDQRVNHDILNKLNEFDSRQNFNLTQFTILVFIILLKLTGIFSYIYVHSLNLKFTDILDMTLIILVYIHTIHNLLRTFGSYDLKRKENQMNYFISIIDFYSDDNLEHTYKEKLDITDPQSLEAFDNARKLMLQKQNIYLGRLDYAYIGLVFYYFFVVVICASYFFEFDWLISKDSSLVDPIWVILSAGNFIFISAFLMFRFKHGTDYNNTFSDLEIEIDHLLDITDDLLTMFNTFFLQVGKQVKRDVGNVTVFHKFSPYGLLVRKIKRMSKNYIDNKLYYQGKLYGKHEKNQLRKDIILIMRQSLEKVKKSIQTDYNSQKYLFMGFFEVEVTSFLYTLVFFIVTSLPSIIPKFIQFYQSPKQ